MNIQLPRSEQAAPAVPPVADRRPLGRLLVEQGVISQSQLIAALAMQARLDAPIGEILIAQGWAREADVMTALSVQSGARCADPVISPPAPALWELLPREIWRQSGCVPVERTGQILTIATSRPERAIPIREALRHRGLIIEPVLCPPSALIRAYANHYAADLAQRAETRVAPKYSCRNRRLLSGIWTLPLLFAGIMAAIMAPSVLVTTGFLLALLTLFSFTALRIIGFAAQVLGQPHPGATHSHDARPDAHPVKLPKVSILVPLYKEREIATALIARLNRLTYPKALLDVVLVLEAHDDVTRAALNDLTLPSWMRVIEVPAGESGLTTKPRAMNYALDFSDGDIIGVWDAEDAPEPDQIERITSRFAEAGPEVACLQGILDYYNPRSNWRARCFTIEYASWFRAVLPGIARLRLVVPLGGTTLFIRRAVLEELGGWDAHNVTEDADLGVRLCRAGYRTEFIDTVTYEEANHRFWPWVRQRSRWLKGFMVTYLVHMRAPRQLWRQLGTARFLGVQAFFLGTVGQFLLAPVLWSFWLVLLGLPNVWAETLGPGATGVIAALLIGSECAGMIIAAVAVSSRERRFLWPWIVTMPLYFPAAVLAAYKALYELAVKPYFWDKTQHGQAGAQDI